MLKEYFKTWENTHHIMFKNVSYKTIHDIAQFRNCTYLQVYTFKAPESVSTKGILSFDLFKKYFGHTAGHVESYFLNHG